MPCQLCLQEKPLRQSHIIPEYFYKQGIYDENHRFLALSYDPQTRDRVHQKGIREQLLCDDCEQHFCTYERYVKEMLYDGLHGQWTEHPTFVLLEGLDYSKVKLFQLSILWRAAVSTLDDFRSVSLGPHTERLRQMLLSGNAGKSHEYGCFMVLPKTKLEIEKNAILMPFQSKFDGHRAYGFMFGGIVWIYLVSSHTSALVDRSRFISISGTLIIQRDVRGSIERFLDDALNRYFAADNERAGNYGR